MGKHLSIVGYQGEEVGKDSRLIKADRGGKGTPDFATLYWKIKAIEMLFFRYCARFEKSSSS